MEYYHTNKSTFILEYLNVSYATVSISCHITFSSYYLSETNKGVIMPITCPTSNKVKVKKIPVLNLNKVSMLS